MFYNSLHSGHVHLIPLSCSDVRFGFFGPEGFTKSCPGLCALLRGYRGRLHALEGFYSVGEEMQGCGAEGGYSRTLIVHTYKISEFDRYDM
jgi:hypothetical protein